MQKQNERVSSSTGKKKSGSHKTYEEHKCVGLFYSIAFFIEANAKFSSSVQRFILPLLPVFFSNYSCAYFCREGRTVTIGLSVQVPKLVKQNLRVHVCLKLFDQPKMLW